MARGVNLLSVMIGMAIGAFVLILIFRVLFSLTPAGRPSSEMQAAYSHLVKMGRLAENCTKASATKLSCEGDISVPSGTFIPFEFEFQGTTLFYRVDRGSGMEVEANYTRIAGFTLCDDADMTAGTCTLTPTKMQTRHAENLVVDSADGPTLPNRFFRFKLSGLGLGKVAQNLGVQGAFYVRNPYPFSGIRFKKGQIEDF